MKNYFKQSAQAQPVTANVHQKKLVSSDVSAFLQEVYEWLFASLLIAGVSALIGSHMAMILNPIVFLIIAIVGFVPLWIVHKKALSSPTTGAIALIIFAVLDGLGLSAIFVVYTKQNLAMAFIASALIFGTMSLIGMTTKRDLSKLGTQLMGALIALIIASFISMLFSNPLIVLLISIAGIVIFSGFTIYDTKSAIDSFKNYRNSFPISGIAIVNALELYLDFVNLFLDILEFISVMFTNNNN